MGDRNGPEHAQTTPILQVLAMRPIIMVIVHLC